MRQVVLPFWISLAAPLAFAQLAPAPSPGERTLAVGDVAPRLEVENWLRGPPIPLCQSGRIHVVEFWTTSNAPSLANFRHLSSLQQSYRGGDVAVVGATSIDDLGNTELAVREFINRRGAELGYGIAWLPESRGAKDRGIQHNPWFKAAGIQNLPCAFLIARDGRIAFIGDPALLDAPLAAVVSGKFDFAGARAQQLNALKAPRLVGEFAGAITWADKPKLVAMAAEIVSGPGRDDPRSLSMLAAIISDSPWKIDPDLLQIALEAATRAVALTKSRAPATMDALSRVQFLRGD